MGKRSRAICFLAILGALAGAPAAEAQGPWGPAVKVCCEHAGYPQLAMNASGGAVLAFNAGGSIQAAVRPPGGEFGQPQEVGRTEHFAPPRVAISETGDAVVAWEAHWQDAHEVDAVLKRGSGGFGPVQILPLSAPFALAIDPAGSALVVGHQPAGEVPERMLGVWSFPQEQSFGHTEDVSGPTRIPSEAPAVAFAGPEAVVAWTAGDPGEGPAYRRMFAAFGTPAGFGAPQRLSDIAGVAPTLAANLKGDAVVVWGGDMSLAHALVAYRRPGSAFSPAQEVSGHGVDSPSVAVGPRGDAMVSWNGFAPGVGHGEGFSSHIADLGAGQTTFQPFDVPGVLHRQGNVGFDGLGDALMVATADGVDGVWSVARLPDGSFGGFDRLPASAPAAAATGFDAKGGGLAVWAARPDGSAPNDIPGPIYASTYDGKVVLARMLPPVVEYLYPIVPGARTASARSRAPRGVRFGLSKPAKVRLTVESLSKKTRRRRPCAAREQRRGVTRCWRYRRIAVSVRSRPIGATTVRFSRRTRRKLRDPGRYRITVQGRDEKGQLGKARSARFRVGRAPRRRSSRV